MDSGIFNEKQKLQLQQMISQYNSVDQTELIRKLKHSIKFKEEINTMIKIKTLYKDDTDKIHLECMNDCPFLFNYYTDIYNKIRKDEINLQILFKFVDMLKRIEDGELNQHEGSFLIGTLLKELYVDSALKKAEKLDEKEEEKEKEPMREGLQISWKDFKTYIKK